jgi:hypothetical protein
VNPFVNPKLKGIWTDEGRKYQDVGHPDYPGVESAVSKIEKECSEVKLILKKFTSVFQKL